MAAAEDEDPGVFLYGEGHDAGQHGTFHTKEELDSIGTPARGRARGLGCVMGRANRAEMSPTPMNYGRQRHTARARPTMRTATQATPTTAKSQPKTTSRASTTTRMTATRSVRASVRESGDVLVRSNVQLGQHLALALRVRMWKS